MTDKVQLIKAEIKRLIGIFSIPQYDCEYNKGKADGFKELLSFINSLHEESVSENLLDEIHNRWEDHPHIKWPKCPYKDFKNIACHFANWQKEQMMKTAVDGKIYETQARSKLKAATIGKISRLKYRVGDKVKLIILKED